MDGRMDMCVLLVKHFSYKNRGSSDGPQNKMAIFSKLKIVIEKRAEVFSRKYRYAH
jgi:hypothetical protein